MKKAFAVNFEVVTVIETNKCKIDQIFIGDQSIGYVAINANNADEFGKPTITPFTADGEMKQEHCPSCAAEALFSSWTFFPAELISTGRVESMSSPLESLLMVAALKSAMRH